MPKTYPDEFKRQAVLIGCMEGLRAASRKTGASVESIRTWTPLYLDKTEQAIPEKFSPAYKELVVKYAIAFGDQAAAQKFGISKDAVKEWQYLKKKFGSASAKNPRNRRGKALPKQTSQNEEAEKQNEYGKIAMTISSDEWAMALYEIYAKDSDVAGFAKFRERLDKFVELVMIEKNGSDNDGNNDGH